ncbi:MAG: nucleoside triphosphate pyrophosphohydrolase family protein [Clostridia bacterium]|nr:nucleoside triphosphate pyrophosphohydrolase family protein [Clostridia bacterium]
MMRIEEYQALAMRTSPEGHDRVLNGCLGLIGESGEIVDVVKKWKFQSGENAELPKDKLIDECGDVLWYCAELCQGLEIDMARAYRVFFGDSPIRHWKKRWSATSKS